MEPFLHKIKKLWPFKDYSYYEEEILEYLHNEKYNIESVQTQFLELVEEINELFKDNSNPEANDTLLNEEFEIKKPLKNQKLLNFLKSNLISLFKTR